MRVEKSTVQWLGGLLPLPQMVGRVGRECELMYKMVEECVTVKKFYSIGRGDPFCSCLVRPQLS
jgi:hypothetical protein